MTRTNESDEATPDADEWRRFGIRDIPPMSARRAHDVPEVFAPFVDERRRRLRDPFVGITTDGIPLSGLRRLSDLPKMDTRPIEHAAAAFLEALTPEQRELVTFPVDAQEWRHWINVHMYYYRHGIMLGDLAPETRALALDILRATLSVHGYEQARAIMQINELVMELTGDSDAFGEWLYFVSIFGSPNSGEPWGWQIDGHHLNLSVVIIDGRLVTTPAFMGSEPRTVSSGPYAGLSLFDREESSALELVRSLDNTQLGRAIVRPSIYSADLPPSLQNPFDGRMQAGSANDNVVLPPQGIAGNELSETQRRLLVDLLCSYGDWTAGAHAAVTMREVKAHLDETWFSWYGGIGNNAVFYYRVHSPVILVEFDHHPGVVFDNPEPTRNHVHTLVRTPNGGDYGIDLLAQHYARFDHTAGPHTAT